MDILKRLLFLFLLFALVCGEVLRIDLGNSIAFTLLDLAVLGFVCISLAIQLFQKRPLVVTIEKYAMLFLALGFFSLLLNLSHLKQFEFLVSFLYIIRYAFYTLGISLSVQLLDEKTRKNIPFLLASTSFILSLLGFVQFFLYPVLRNLYYAGWDEHLYRLFATFLDPNFMGLFYALGVLLSFYAIVHAQKQKHTISFIYYIVVCLSSSIALFLTYSRSAYLALAVGMMCLVYRFGGKKLLGISIAILIGIFIVIAILGHKYEGTNILRTASVLNRVTSDKQVTTIFVHNALFGVGFDAYRYAQERYGFIKQNATVTHAGAGADNSFLFVMATTGIIGFLAYAFLSMQIVRLGYKNKGFSGQVLFASYTAIAIGSITVDALFYPFILIWLWVLIGLTESTSH